MRRREEELYPNAMLEAVKFPAGIANLDTGLTNVDRDALSHFLRKIEGIIEEALEIGRDGRAKGRLAFMKTPFNLIIKTHLGLDIYRSRRRGRQPNLKCLVNN